jgi:hypothetical protein
MSPGDSKPQFDQPVTLDWVELGSLAVKFPKETRARLADCDIDSRTAVAAVAIGQRVILSPSGARRVGDAIAACRAYESLNPDLWFGFRNSIPKMLSTSHEGLSFVGISAALSEGFEVDYAAGVLQEILSYFNLSPELAPSLGHWLRIVNACAGTLAKTDFGKLVQKLRDLHGSEPAEFVGGTYENLDDRWPSRSSSETMAKAFVELAQVARTPESSITIEGGKDVGFLAAVAEWLLDMSIVITNGSGATLYPNYEPKSPIQARFILFDRFSESSQSHHVGSTYPRTRLVRLNDISDFLYTNGEDNRMKAGGRLPWDECLSRSFNLSFNAPLGLGEMFGLKRYFASAIGSAARVFEAVARAEPGVDFSVRKRWIYYTNEGSGGGFIQNLMHWFPELKVIETDMLRAVESGFKDAQSQYEASMAKIAEHCNCPHCTVAPKTTDRSHCFVLVAETVLQAGLILSNVEVDEGLCPLRAGFERLYNAQLKTRSLDDQTRTIFEKDMGPIAWVIEPKTADDRETDNNRMRVMIEGALGLFGPINPLRDSDSCAWSNNGICAYRTILRNLSMHNEFGYSLGRIHIVPGRIEWQNRSYDQIQDLSPLPPFDFRTDDNRIDPTQLLGFEPPSLELKEKLQGSDCMLMGAFRLPNINKLPLFIAPTNIGNCAMMAHGLYQCQRCASCNENRQAITAMPEFHVHKRLGKEVTVYKAPNDLSVLAAIAIGSLLKDKYLPLCGGECLECALRTATDELEPFTQDNADTDAQTRPLLVIVRLYYINTG